MTHVLATNHVGFTVSELDASIALFTEVFGYTLVSRAPRPGANAVRLTGIAGAAIVVAHLRREGLAGVELIAYAGPSDRGRAAARPCDVGFAHMTFDVDDLDAVVADAARFGLVPLGDVIESVAGPNIGARAIYLRDGDGMHIELIQPARFAR